MSASLCTYSLQTLRHVCMHVPRTTLHCVAVREAGTDVPTAAWSFIMQFVMHDSELSLSLECCIVSFGSFPGVWILYTDVSENAVSSIFLGFGSRMRLFGVFIWEKL